MCSDAPFPVQQQSDWVQASTTAPSYIKNKPAIPAAQVQSDWNQANSGAVDFIKKKPTIPAAQVQSNWTQATTDQPDYIKNKPTLIAGQSTLVAGTVNVTITGITISGIVLVTPTKTGVLTGMLRVVAKAGFFTVESDNLTDGSIINTDTVTFNYFVVSL